MAFGAILTSCAQETNNTKKYTELVTPFYQEFLSAGSKNEDLIKIAKKSMHDDWISTDGYFNENSKNIEQLAQTFGYFHQGIPDLKWEVQEVIVSGNKIIVRSKITGTPNIPDNGFFGIPTDGSKSFEILSIDIHTLNGDKIRKSYHMENWSNAIMQLTN